MNRLIKEQLDKVQVANVGHYDDDTLEINIPKTCIDKYNVNECYIVCLDDKLLNATDNPLLVSNWNHNTYPQSKYMKINVLNVVGKMIKVDALGYDCVNNVCTNYSWGGWLPSQLIKQLK